MAKKKGARQMILMVSKEDPKIRYTTSINLVNQQAAGGQTKKLVLKKYSPSLRKKVEFVQTKIK
jgi:ribosomal protein L33